MSHIVDDKSDVCLEFILQQLKQRPKSQNTARIDAPFMVGLNGVQGCGKTTLVCTLAEKLRQPPYSLPTIVLSIDDLYLPRKEQADFAAKHPENPLVQRRGQPSTHDINLGLTLISDLQNGQLTKIPAYDKSAFQGLGDRFPEENWLVVNQDGQPAIKVVILEGWCVGFRALDSAELRCKWDAAVTNKERGEHQGRLGTNRFEDVEFINNALKSYDQLTDQFEALIHVDAEDNTYVYQWRMEQEAALRQSKGSGMTDDQVIDFVNRYYPAYELFVDKLRTGLANGGQKKQLRLVIGRDRRLKQILLV